MVALGVTEERQVVTFTAGCCHSLWIWYPIAQAILAIHSFICVIYLFGIVCFVIIIYDQWLMIGVVLCLSSTF